MADSLKLRLVLEIGYRHMTDAEIGDDYEPEDGEEYGPDEYEAVEIGRSVIFALGNEEVQAEMFAGSGVFLKTTAVNAVSAEWVPTPAKTGGAL